MSSVEKSATRCIYSNVDNDTSLVFSEDALQSECDDEGFLVVLVEMIHKAW